MSALEIIIQNIVNELVAERNPAFVESSGVPCPAASSPRQLVADLVWLLWRPNRRTQCSSVDYEAMLSAIVKSSRWRRMRMHFQEIQRHASSSQEEAKLAEMADMIGFVVKSVVCRLLHFSPSKPVGLTSLVEAYQQLEAAKEPLLNDFILVAMELARKAKLRRFLPQWVNQELVLACLESVRELSRHREWCLAIHLVDGETEEKRPGNYAGSRGVTVKTREDQIPDILPPEWRYCDVDRDVIASVLRNEDDTLIDQSKEAMEKFGLKYVIEKCLVIERHRQHNVDVRQKLLVPVIIGAEARVQRPLEMEAQVKARQLAFEFIMTAAMKIPELIDVDVAWFERRDERWIGTAFPLRAVTCAIPKSDNWMNLVELDNVLPHFFVRWTAGVAVKRRDCEIIRETTPAAYLERQLALYSYHAVSTAVIMREDEMSLCVPPPTLTLPQVKGRPHSVLLATVSEKEQALRGACLRDLVAAAVVNLPLPVAAADQLVRNFASLLFGPVLASKRRIFKTA